MSVYDLNRLLFDMKNDGTLARDLRRNFPKAIKPYDLTKEEKKAIKTEDTHLLLKLGARGNLIFAVHRMRPEYANTIYFRIR
jgi:hypothetical protein